MLNVRKPQAVPGESALVLTFTQIICADAQSRRVVRPLRRVVVDSHKIPPTLCSRRDPLPGRVFASAGMPNSNDRATGARGNQALTCQWSVSDKDQCESSGWPA